MGTASRVMFDAFHQVRSGSDSGKVNSTDTALVTTTTVPNGHSTGMVTTTLTMTTFGECQFLNRSALPQMIVNWSPQVSDTRCARFIRSKEDAGIFAGRRGSESNAGVEVGRVRFLLRGFLRLIYSCRISPSGEQKRREASEGKTEARQGHPSLKHRGEKS